MPNPACVIHPNKPQKYGYVYEARNKVKRQAHQWAFEDAWGPIPAGKEVHHICGEKRCVEPTHLLAVTWSQHRLFHPHISSKGDPAKHNATKRERRKNDPAYREYVNAKNRETYHRNKNKPGVKEAKAARWQRYKEAKNV